MPAPTAPPEPPRHPAPPRPPVAPAAPGCRAGCAACCIAPSISSPIPGMPAGKPAGTPCVQLDEALRCRLFGRPERPAVCSGLSPSAEMCGANRTHALHWLAQLEAATRPGACRGATAASGPA